jgi:hypothetical protein
MKYESKSKQHVESVNEFIDLFLRSRFYVPVQATLDPDDIGTATHLKGFHYWVAPGCMVKGEVDGHGMAAWQPVDSPISLALLRRFECFIGHELPGLFKCYLCTRALLNVNLEIGTLPAIDPDRPLEWIEWYWRKWAGPPYNFDEVLIPFAHGPALASVLCFGTRERSPDGDYAIIQVMNRSKPDEIFDENQCRMEKVFDSFGEYFEFLKNWMRFVEHKMPKHINEWINKNNMKNPMPSYYD